MKYDVVIIGSGLGGLQCAYILSREGYNVCLLEKNNQLGGCLQTFRRNNTVFDTGMHYIGSMDEGQVLNKFFRYFKLSGKLNLRRMDENGYEIIHYKGKEYKFAMGYDRFVETMLEYFPKESEALMKYTTKMKELSTTIDLFNMRELSKQQTRYFDYFNVGIDDFLNSITCDQTMKNTLLGISPLYAGVRNRTPMYIHLIIHASYIGSAYRFVDGGSQISDLLAGYITENGGTIIKKAEVTEFLSDSGSLKAVEINHSEKIEGKYFISNIHPKTMLQISEDIPLRPAYKKRIAGIEDTHGIFTLYLAMKKNAFEYINSNYYVYKTENVWGSAKYNSKNWPRGYMMSISPRSGNEQYTDAIIVNTYMNWKEVTPWEHSTVEKRGEDYKEFKRQKAEKLLDVLEKDFPGIRSKTEAYYTSTPLTYRDYIGTSRGSMYGLLKDYNDPLRTMVLPRTHIPNLYLTGQNINIHGVMGVTFGSILTCSELIGSQYLLNKIHDA
jgi:all-trans-retinol 13,14-reductase